MMANKIPKIDNVWLIDNAPDENNIQEINKSEVLVYEIDNYEIVREKYPYKFLKRSW